MKKYEKYKKIDLPWLSEIPKHWNIIKNKFCFELYKEIVGVDSFKTELLSLTKKGVKIKSKEISSGKQPSTFDTYQYVYPNQLVMCLYDLDCSAVFSGLSNYYGMISPSYNVYKITNLIYPKFTDYWFSYCFINREYKIFSTSLRFTMNDDVFKSINIPIPPFEEQKQIANYLDWKINEIDKLKISLSNILDCILLLKKSYSNTLILENLFKSTKYKLSNLLNECSIKNKPQMKLLSVVREKGVIIRNVNDLNENHNYIPEDLSGYKMVKKGQFVINKMKAWQGSYGVSEYDGIVSPAYFVFNLLVSNKDFFNFAIRTQYYIDMFAKNSDGIRVGQWDLSINKMKNIVFFYLKKINKRKFYIKIEE